MLEGVVWGPLLTIPKWAVVGHKWVGIALLTVANPHGFTYSTPAKIFDILRIFAHSLF